MEKALNSGAKATTKKLGEKSLEYMKNQYSSNNLEGHIDNITLRAYNKSYENGFVISSGNDEVAVYNEFGIGMVGAKEANPLASDAGYEYNVESPHKGKAPKGAIKQWGKEYCDRVTTADTWWYFKEGKWWHSRGYTGKQMYSSLVEELNKSAIDDYNASVSQTIGGYGGKK